MAFIIYYCDARLNAGSILAATGIFLYFYYRNKTEWRLFSLLPFFGWYRFFGHDLSIQQV